MWVSPGRAGAPLATPVQPVQKRVFGGCHLNRRIVDLLATAGFNIAEVDVFYERTLRNSWPLNPSALLYLLTWLVLYRDQ
jgi:hypothetical protein